MQCCSFNFYGRDGAVGSKERFNGGNLWLRWKDTIAFNAIMLLFE